MDIPEVLFLICFLGMIILSGYVLYLAKRKDGTMTIEQNAEGIKVFMLDLEDNPNILAKRRSVKFKVVNK